jgi:small-conductance mechanosensitive channel/CRP-like cAMP-binding protein
MVPGLILLAATLGLRAAAAANRHIARKLFASAAAFGSHAGLAILAQYAPLTFDTPQVHTVQPLLLTFGLVNLVVALSLNPWREDRLPDRFPNIVQDSIVVLLFVIVATALLRDRVLVPTAAGAVILGLAMQDTLGNLIAGLAIQVEKPFGVGHWVSLGGQEGVVSEITWRATRIRTRAGNLVIVPNNVLARERIINFSEPTFHTLFEIEVAASYDTPPNRVKEVVLDAIRDQSLMARDRPPRVLVSEFGDSGIKYLIQVWTMDFAAGPDVRDRVRTAVYYAFRRHGIVIPYPVQVQVRREWVEQSADRRLHETALGDAAIFASLTGEQRAELLAAARPRLYGAGEVIVREGDTGNSMFVIADGEAGVTVESGAGGTAGAVARLREGDFFGEMSLLTGEPRTATVTAATDCNLIEIAVEGFRAFLMAEPSVAEIICAAVAARRSQLDEHRTAAASAGPAGDAPRSLLSRMRQFLGLGGG